MKDLSILRVVAFGLVLALLLIIIGVFLLLLLTERTIPNEVWAVGFSIVTGLLGMLAPSRAATAGE